MSIWVGEHSRIIVQGITGKSARLHTEQMVKYGSQIVGGVSPRRNGKHYMGIPIYDTMAKAVEETGANTSIIFVPAPYAAGAIKEAIDTEIELVICVTEHIPLHDMLDVHHYLKGKKTRLIGPNCPGIITPDKSKIGIMPSDIHQKGSIGIVSRSGTLTYEAVAVISNKGWGQSTAVGIGGDPIKGTDFIDVLMAFNEDKETEAVVLIGEIGGNSEEKAAEWIKKNMKKPVVAFISGRTAPKGKRMGHAGAIISGNSGTAESKIEAFESAGVPVAMTFSDIVPQLIKVLK